ncbi:adenylate/guanylate cyclase domain-containing protein [Flavihumibacter sp.]|uniref:adenylate/guanylate cyclase domain-containing protein n=1 Tax=Flavihumibacter sp. TaxID=1913981 RepID=UPI002FC9867A|nr:adenylate/guanylate cyclase domain-containing protein [Flavihumibacter sediminis]
MGKGFEYTTLAYRHTARFPVLSYIVIQVYFWSIANILLATIIYLHSLIINQTYGIDYASSFGTMLVIAVIMGLVLGISLGFVGYYQERKYFRKQPLGRLIVFKTLISLAVLVFWVIILRYFLLDLIIVPLWSLRGLTLSEMSLRYIILMIIVYYFFMAMAINFINQVNKKYGPGVVVPLLLGRYRTPREEERIFMFMDLKSSTSTAEKLGHLRYSSFIRDCFSDINEQLYSFRAQVYQYVGDEIVLTWPEREGLKQHFCIRFYFAVKKQFEDRADYYISNYGLVPEFKAGVHTGMVTAVEIGELKREIAYHGDTLNTAARIQHVCNEYGRRFIASQYLIDKIRLATDMKAYTLGMVHLKGKEERIGLVALD